MRDIGQDERKSKKGVMIWMVLILPMIFLFYLKGYEVVINKRYSDAENHSGVSFIERADSIIGEKVYSW